MSDVCQMRIQPSKSPGLYDLVSDNGFMLREAVTHREAWLAFDKISGEPISRAEDVTNWAAKIQANKKYE